MNHLARCKEKLLQAQFLPRNDTSHIISATSLEVWFGFMVYVCLNTCCSHFLTIIAGVDLHFSHESELPVCQTRGLNPDCRGARRD